MKTSPCAKCDSRSGYVPSPHDRIKLASCGELSPATVKSAYMGGAIRPLCRLRLERAALRLGLPPPIRPKEKAGYDEAGIRSRVLRLVAACDHAPFGQPTPRSVGAACVDCIERVIGAELRRVVKS